MDALGTERDQHFKFGNPERYVVRKHSLLLIVVSMAFRMKCLIPSTTLSEVGMVYEYSIHWNLDKIPHFASRLRTFA